MAIVFLQRHRSNRGGQVAGGAVAGDSGPFRSRECPTKPAGLQDGPTIRPSEALDHADAEFRTSDSIFKEPNTYFGGCHQQTLKAVR
jgi:hypothetical protein